jgi:hypothetical protein
VPEDASRHLTRRCCHLEFVLPRSPYSSDLPQSGVHLSYLLKVADDDDEPKHSKREELRLCSRTFVTDIQRVTQRCENCGDNEGEFVKNNLSFVKNVPMTYVNCIIIVVVVSEKQ